MNPDTTDEILEEPLNQTVSEQDSKNDILTEKIEKESSSVISITLASFVFLVIAIFYMHYIWDSSKKGTENELKKYINLWKEDFPNQNDRLWSDIESQMEEFLEMHSKAPLTFLMVYKEADETAKLLASAVSSTAVKLKHKDDKCGDRNEHKLKGNDPLITQGYLLETKLPNITNCKKLIIYNIEKLPPSAAADLHSLLDPDYPNVPSAVYVLTLKVTEGITGKLYHSVTDVLMKQWGSGLELDLLEPLLSRIPNFVKIERENFDQL